MPINKVKDAMPTIPEERCEKCYEADGNHFVLCPEAGYDFSYDMRLQQAADDVAEALVRFTALAWARLDGKTAS